MGNIIGLRRATGPPGDGKPPLRVVLAAHADEIGMMVKYIDGDGLIRFQRIGGLEAPVLVSQHVMIHGREAVRGVIAPGRGGDVPKAEDLVIDLGLTADEVRERVEVGDIVTLGQEFVVLNESIYAGRNFDDRIGLYCLLEAMRRLGPAAVDAYAVSTVQEEVGVRGMPTAAFAIEPHLGLAIDGSLAWGAGFARHEHLCGLGEGTGIYLIDNLTVGDPRLVRFLFDLCEREGIRCQRNIGGGTDASAIQRARGGAVTTTIGAPVRYMHSTVQLCHRDDVEATIALLRAFLEHAHELEVIAR